MLKSRSYFIAAVWLIMLIVSFAYFVSERIVAFDPEEKLLKQDVKMLVTELQQMFADHGILISSSKSTFINTLYHLKVADCHCNSVTEPHINELSQKATTQGFNVKHLTLTEEMLTALPKITATPAVVFIGTSGELVYFGPYAKGLACSETSGMIELAMNNYQKGFNNQLIYREAKGCYCHSIVKV